jgi:hypothetical protein
MIGRLCLLESWQKATQNLIRRGVRIVAILALTFVLVGANPSSSAQAAPAIDNFDYVLIAIPLANPICTGQSTLIRVSLSRQLRFGLGDAAPVMVSRAEVAALSNNNVGTITPDRMFIGHPSTFDPNSVLFRFTARDDPGVAEIRFRFILSSDLGGITINKDFQFVVSKCSYKVLTILQAPLPPIGLITFTPDEIKLEETSSEHFSGATDLKIKYSDYNFLGCPLVLTVTPTMIEYKAHMDNDRLYLDFTIQKFTETVTANCGEGSPPPIIYDIATGTGTVNVPSQGGVTSYSTPLGPYLFIITRVSDGDTSH